MASVALDRSRAQACLAARGTSCSSSSRCRFASGSFADGSLRRNSSSARRAAAGDGSGAGVDRGSGAGARAAAAAGSGVDGGRADKARRRARSAAFFARRLSRDAFLWSMSPEGQGNVRGSPVAVALALSPRLGSPAQPTVRSPMLTRLRGSSDVVWPGRR